MVLLYHVMWPKYIYNSHMLLSPHWGDLRHSVVHTPLSLLVVEIQDAVPVFICTYLW